MEANSLHEHDKRLSKANTVASLPTFYIGSTPGTDNTIDANTNNKNSPTSRNENNQEATNEKLKTSRSMSQKQNDSDTQNVMAKTSVNINCKTKNSKNDASSSSTKPSPTKNPDAESVSSTNSGLEKKEIKVAIVPKQAEIATESSSESISSDFSPVNCSCDEHLGKEMLNVTLTLSVNYLFECIFGPTEFCRKYWETRKFYDMKVADWEVVDGFKCRQLDYSMVISNLAIVSKNCSNTEKQKIIKYIPNKCITVESYSMTHGVPYADYFAVICRFCITKIDDKRSNLKIHSYIKYLQKPVFAVKVFIERNSMGALKDAYQYLVKNFIELSEYKQDDVPQISAYKEEPVKSQEFDDFKDKAETLKAPQQPVTQPQRRHKIKRTVTKSNRSNSQAIQTDHTIKSQQSQLVPIQTFQFLKYSIQVDTLVRLFIIAMIFLMIINGILYLKLRRIENLADALKNNPNFASRYNSITSGKCENGCGENTEMTQFRQMMPETIKAIEKMNKILQDWNENIGMKKN